MSTRPKGECRCDGGSILGEQKGKERKVRVESNPARGWAQPDTAARRERPSPRPHRTHLLTFVIYNAHDLLLLTSPAFLFVLHVSYDIFSIENFWVHGFRS